MRLISLFLLFASLLPAQDFVGFYDFTYSDEDGKVTLEITEMNESFIYVNSLAAGVGSNDIGLDRGQLGGTHLVHFEKRGNKVFLIKENTSYRAITDNEDERIAVKEAFAKSILWSFKILDSEEGKVKVDMTPFLLRDAHNVAQTLKKKGQGTYKLDKERSAVYVENTMSFPDNSEFESIITFVGEPKGREIRSVTPDAASVTVRMHHSFVRLPDDGYRPRAFHPHSGYFYTSYADYASPIDQPIQKRYIRRHRLNKANKNAAKSKAVEPIIYYIDRGCPEPIKSALIEGASWWNEAFEAAGYVNAFQVKELPVGAHPLDVRYNMIQWVHRSTRGWSYGGSVADPRTGEIIKGHVSLGSLRVRQDFLIAQGLIPAYKEGEVQDERLVELALARLRQLSAHEVGHTIGLAHNFAASIDDRASVMDYPHPKFEVTPNGVSIDDAYATGIGEWDKRAIIYGYKDVDSSMENDTLESIIEATQKMGLRYITDQNARSKGSAHAYAHLWDSGTDPIGELHRIMRVRTYGISNFSYDNLQPDQPISELTKVYVPLYYMHRYQIEAVAKLIGGYDFDYALKGERQSKFVPVDKKSQELAKEALLKVIDPKNLATPNRTISMLSPAAYGYSPNRESFTGNTGSTFDPVAAAGSLGAHVFDLMLEESRLSRINQLGSGDLFDYLRSIMRNVDDVQRGDNQLILIRYELTKLLVEKLIYLSIHAEDKQVAGISRRLIEFCKGALTEPQGWDSTEKQAHKSFIRSRIKLMEERPDLWKQQKAKPMPPGSPIGCNH